MVDEQVDLVVVVLDVPLEYQGVGRFEHDVIQVQAVDDRCGRSRVLIHYVLVDTFGLDHDDVCTCGPRISVKSNVRGLSEAICARDGIKTDVSHDASPYPWGTSEQLIELRIFNGNPDSDGVIRTERLLPPGRQLVFVLSRDDSVNCRSTFSAMYLSDGVLYLHFRMPDACEDVYRCTLPRIAARPYRAVGGHWAGVQSRRTTTSVNPLASGPSAYR